MVEGSLVVVGHGVSTLLRSFTLAEGPLMTVWAWRKLGDVGDVLSPWLPRLEIRSRLGFDEAPRARRNASRSAGDGWKALSEEKNEDIGV